MLFNGTVYSKTLHMDTGVVVVAPNDVPPEAPYKVAYLLHGISGNSLSWAHYSLLPVYAARRKTVYILPDAARSFYSDMRFGFDYYTYVTEELPLICKSLFNISARREDTFILGNSMGGFGALRCALTKPEQYGGCGAFSSPCLFLREEMDLFRRFGSREQFVAQFGERLFEDFTCAFGPDLDCGPGADIPALVQKLAESPEKPAIYCTCGSKDPFLDGNRRFAEFMRAMPFDFTFEEWEGEHDFAFFDQSLKHALDKFAL